MKNFRVRKILHELTQPNGFEVACFGQGIDVHVHIIWREPIGAFIRDTPWFLLREDMMIMSRKGIFQKRRLGI